MSISSGLNLHKIRILIILSISSLFVNNCNSQVEESYKTVTHTTNEYTNTNPYTPVKIDSQIVFGSKPKNIILLIGDGMGVAQIYAGMTANGGQLNLMQMPITGFSITACSDNYITDSGAGGTAISTGEKTYYHAIGVNADTIPVETILEKSEKEGYKTGLISTSAITHATPAAFIAHQKDRSMYEDIAADFLKTDIDLFIGGGKKHFESRVDDRNLIDELKSKGYQVVDSLSEVRNIYQPYAVFTAEIHDKKYPERGDILPNATEMALKSLSMDSKGFFIMIEGSQIDWGGHQNDTKYIVNEMLDFDRAIGKALEFAAKDKNTLVIVTADHETGGMAITGGSFQQHNIKATYASTKHTAIMVPVFAFGPGAEQFSGIYQNNEIYKKMIILLGF